jgi:3-hydroxymyristoyl/3-hydroxydecanoyl-(acyl carrier protein) dehydratase
MTMSVATAEQVRFRSGTEVMSRTEVRGTVPGAPVYPGVLPIAAARRAVAELVGHTRGPGWHVELREVAALRLFGPLAAGDLLTTRVTCTPALPDGELVATAQCTRAGTPIANLTMRLAVVPDVPPTDWGRPCPA